MALPEHREHPRRVVPLDTLRNLSARAGIPEELRAPLDHARLVALVNAIVPREAAVVVERGVQGRVRIGHVVREVSGEAKGLPRVAGSHRRDERLVKVLDGPGDLARAAKTPGAVARPRGGDIGRDVGEGRLREALEVEVVPHLLALAVKPFELGVRLERAHNQLLASFAQEGPEGARRPLDGVSRDDPVPREAPGERISRRAVRYEEKGEKRTPERRHGRAGRDFRRGAGRAAFRSAT